MAEFSWLKLIWALLLIVMLWRMYPLARHWMQNGPRGSTSEWMNVALLLVGVMAFVFFLMSVV